MSGLTFKMFGTLDMIRKVHQSITDTEAGVNFTLDANTRKISLDPTAANGWGSEVVFYDHFITFESEVDATLFAIQHPGMERS